MNQQMQTAPGTAAQPPAQLKTNRSLLKFILLSLITFGIYGIVVMSSISNDINLIAGRYDGKKTMHYWPYLYDRQPPLPAQPCLFSPQWCPSP